MKSNFERITKTGEALDELHNIRRIAEARRSDLTHLNPNPDNRELDCYQHILDKVQLIQKYLREAIY